MRRTACCQVDLANGSHYSSSVAVATELFDCQGGGIRSAARNAICRREGSGDGKGSSVGLCLNLRRGDLEQAPQSVGDQHQTRRNEAQRGLLLRRAAGRTGLRRHSAAAAAVGQGSRRARWPKLETSELPDRQRGGICSAAQDAVCRRDVCSGDEGSDAWLHINLRRGEVGQA